MVSSTSRRVRTVDGTQAICAFPQSIRRSLNQRSLNWRRSRNAGAGNGILRAETGGRFRAKNAVPWMKRHQALTPEEQLPGPVERYAQLNAIHRVLTQEGGYVAVGLDHYALPSDAMAKAAVARRLKRSFQGYTTDAAPALIGFGASSMGSLPQGYVQNAPTAAANAKEIEGDRLATVRGVALTGDDRLRRDVIERVMCDLEVDVDTIASEHGADPAPSLLSWDITGVEGLGQISRCVPFRHKPPPAGSRRSSSRRGRRWPSDGQLRAASTQTSAGPERRALVRARFDAPRQTSVGPSVGVAVPIDNAQKFVDRLIRVAPDKQSDDDVAVALAWPAQRPELVHGAFVEPYEIVAVAVALRLITDVVERERGGDRVESLRGDGDADHNRKTQGARASAESEACPLYAVMVEVGEVGLRRRMTLRRRSQAA